LAYNGLVLFPNYRHSFCSSQPLAVVTVVIVVGVVTATFALSNGNSGGLGLRRPVGETSNEKGFLAAATMGGTFDAESERIEREQMSREHRERNTGMNGRKINKLVHRKDYRFFESI
jgi:hypothetical protein